MARRGIETRLILASKQGKILACLANGPFLLPKPRRLDLSGTRRLVRTFDEALQTTCYDFRWLTCTILNHELFDFSS
jgi:hypothetical protein